MAEPTEPAAGDPPRPARSSVPEVFSREYVTELREEARATRLKAAEHEAAALAAREAAKAADTAAAAKIAEAEARAQARIVRTEMRAAASKLGMVDPDVLSLIPLDRVTFDKNGDPENVDAVLAEFKKAKPALFSASSSSGARPPASDPPAAKNAKDMTKEERQSAAKALGINIAV